MNRILVLLASIVAVAVLAVVGWFALAGDPAPAPRPRPAPPAPPPTKEEPEAPEFVPLPPEEEEPAAEPPAGEEPIPPDAYPWEVPHWWMEIDRKFREKEILLAQEPRRPREILDLVAQEVGFPVRFGPELEGWEKEASPIFLRAAAPARAVLDELAARLNLEPVLLPDAMVLHQRGRAPDTRVVRAGRVHRTILEARERHAGLREADLQEGDMRSQVLSIGFDRLPLREAARVLGRKLGVPVYLDGALWRVNPVVNLPPRERTLGGLLDELVLPWEAAADATPRRIVLFRRER